MKSFSQNRYIITYLRSDLKPKEPQYDEYAEHKLKIILYCRDEKGQKGICPMCMSEKHLTHQVVNILDEVKKQCFPKIDQLIENFKTYHGQFLMAKQQIQEDLDNIVKQATQRKDKLFKELDAKILDINDNIATLNDIRDKVQKCASYDEMVNKMGFVDLLEELFRERKHPKTYKSFKLEENEQKFALPCEVPKQLESGKVLPVRESVSNLSVAEGKLNYSMFSFHCMFSFRLLLTQVIEYHLIYHPYVLSHQFTCCLVIVAGCRLR